MKKFFTLVCAAACMLTVGCSGGGNELVFKNYKDSIGVGDGDKVSFAIASVDFPVKGDEHIVKSIVGWIESFTQGSIDGDKYKKYVERITKRIFVKPEGNEAGFGCYENTLEIGVLYDTTSLVTMSGLVYNYSGGSHGVHKTVTVTFRKSDGKMFGKEMIADCDSPVFKRLVKKYMMDYFDVADDASLRQYLSEDAIEGDPNGDWWVKLPGALLPYIDKDGNVVVTYGLYEIASYACGEVESCIPKDEIWPLLTEEGKRFY